MNINLSQAGVFFIFDDQFIDGLFTRLHTRIHDRLEPLENYQLLFQNKKIYQGVRPRNQHIH